MKDLAQRYFANTWQLRRVMINRFQGVSAQIGFTPVQGEIVMLIVKSTGQVTAKDIAQMLRISPGAVSQQLDALEKRGCVIRLPSTADRRSVQLSVNEDDAEVLRLRAYMADIAHEVATGLSQAELEHMIRIQEKLIAVMTKNKDQK